MHFDHFLCAILETSNFIVPVWRCPVRNITRKIDGINSFISEEILGRLGPGESGPGQLGPGQLGPGQLGPGEMLVPNCQD